MLAGGLLKTIDDGVVSYVGMLLGRFGIYGLSVFGGYADDHGSPSFFVFGAVNGPIGGPPAFFVTGLGGGLGINRGAGRCPTTRRQFADVPVHPGPRPGRAPPADPMDELRQLNAFFPAHNGNFWFAAGISFTCFALVDGIAVVAVAFGDGLEVDLLGLARMALPNPAAPLVSIELGLLANFSTKDGVFEIQAALTDNSWLLYPEVRLTGGFAFVIWWKGPLSGQFVVTLGGYHPDFHHDGYPDVPRLGLVWQISDAIVIKGGCYFALTSEAVMAGVGVQAIADFGWAWARIEFGADGIVYFDPFFFDVSVQATISAGVEIDTWLGTISFSITTGCGVHVWGPDFSGEATVEVGPCSVTIPWGSERRVEGVVLDWPTFVGKYLEDSGNGTARALSAITGAGSLPAATGGDRSAPQPDGSAAHPYEVFAEFELSIVTSVPADGFAVGDGGTVPVLPTRSDGAGTSLGLNPMRLGQVSSTVTVTLQRLDQVSGQWLDDTADLDQLAQGLQSAAPDAATSRIVTGSFPLGAWGPPDPVGTPAPALPQGNVVFAGNQVSLVARAELLARGPQIDSRLVEAGRRPLPLQATGTQRTTLLDNAATVALPHPTDASGALLAASASLFATAAVQVAKGPQPRGTRSRLAAAAYAGDVAAPPLFGNLSDGLAASNAGNATTDESPAPTPPAAPTPRSPRMLGYLTAGSAVVARVAGTTVSDASIKRRSAPTTDSVHARLGVHLPIGLDVSLPPGGSLGTTYSPTAMPSTGAAGSARSYGFAQGLAASRMVGLNAVGGALPKGVAARRKAAVTAAPEQDGPLLRSGDVVVLHQVDHAIDVGDRRPSLSLDGAARVVLLRGDGYVLADDAVQGTVSVPPGTAFAAVQADGLVDVTDGLAGWHARSRVVALGSGAALAPGCVLEIAASLNPGTVAWSTAGDLVREASSVLTRFSRPVGTVVLVIESDDPSRVDSMGLALIGATRARTAAGAPVEATVLVNGTQVVRDLPGGARPRGGRGLGPRRRGRRLEADRGAGHHGRTGGGGDDALPRRRGRRDGPRARHRRPGSDRHLGRGVGRGEPRRGQARARGEEGGRQEGTRDKKTVAKKAGEEGRRQEGHRQEGHQEDCEEDGGQEGHREEDDAPRRPSARGGGPDEHRPRQLPAVRADRSAAEGRRLPVHDRAGAQRHRRRPPTDADLPVDELETHVRIRSPAIPAPARPGPVDVPAGRQQRGVRRRGCRRS